MLKNSKSISAFAVVVALLLSISAPTLSTAAKTPPVQLKSPQNIIVTPTLPVGEFTVSWNSVPNASSYTVTVYNSSGKTLAGPAITSATSVLTVTRSINTSYRVSVQAIGNSLTFLNSPESGKYSITTFASTYGITWSHNGFGGSSLTPGPTTYTTGLTIVSLPVTTTRAGYSFDGWYVDSGFSGSAITSSYTPASPYGAITFYAKWNTTVTFDGNTSDGGATSAQTASVATALTSNGFTKTGYTFAGWNTVADGSGTQYADQASYPFSGGAATLYAQWTANTNNAITWDDQSATSASSGGSSVYTTAAAVATIPTVDPIKTGYSFGGWYTAVNGGGTVVTGGSYTPASPYGAVTFYAKWTAISSSLAIGATGPGGGIIYYYDSAGFNCGAGFNNTGSPTGGLCHYLEVALDGWNTGADPLKVWAVFANTGSGISDIADDSSAYNNALGIGLGYKNSDLIVTQNGAYNASSNDYAAGAARAYSSNSLTDWYLPTTAELNLLCQWNRGVAQSVTTVCTGGGLNSGPGATGAGFVGTHYYSSSEYGAIDAWRQNFSNGSQGNDSKKYIGYVRPVRAF